MSYRAILVLAFIFLFPGFILAGPDGNVPAFPGAKGFGATTDHGRGGEVIAVTNLNDSGPGSLRAAVRTEGPRIIVFRTGGIIHLEEPIVIREPNVMIAGQTAPGDGICLANRHLRIATHDVVVRFLRVRSGDRGEIPEPETQDAIEVADPEDPPHHVVVDHCSASWAIDENLTSWYPCHDVTFQWCITSEALHDSLHPKGPHSKGFLVGDNAKRMSIHHNLFAHNHRRNALFKAGTSGEFVNNLVYNWADAATHFSNWENTNRPITVDVVGNLYVPGPDRDEIPVYLPSKSNSPPPYGMPPESAVHLSGNLLNESSGPVRDQRKLVNRTGSFLVKERNFPEGVRAEPAGDGGNAILRGAGAIAPERDSVDQRMVKDVRNRSGGLVDSVSDTNGYPSYAAGEPPEDTDGDGMPDAWEREHDLDPEDPSDGRADRDEDGYTNVEEYLNSLVPDRAFP